MTRIIKLFMAVALCFAVLLTGCSAGSKPPAERIDDPTTAENPFAVGEDGTGITPDASFSYGPLVRSVSFDGSPLNVVYEFDNAGSSFEFGLLAFIDGVLQPYSSDSDPGNSYLHAFQLEEGERAEITLTITPTVGTKGQIQYLRTVVVLHPFYQPDLTKPVLFGHNLECGADNYIPVEYLVDAESEGTSIATDAGSGVVHVEDISQQTEAYYKENGLSLDEPRLILEDLDTDSQSLAGEDSYQFTITGIGGSSCDYRLYLFCNLEPYVFSSGALLFPRTERGSTFLSNLEPYLLSSGAHYVDFPIEKGKQTSIDIDLDLSALNAGDTVTVFALAIPVVHEPDNYTIRSLQSERYLFVKE
ncbi:MAG: hypothetical protein LBS98_00340 [Coriobacteriales bacterium]|nr:hypothetical protein [Coriobacteriales bacterium]